MVGVLASRGGQSTRVVGVSAGQSGKSTRVVGVSAGAVAVAPGGVGLAFHPEAALPADDGGGTGRHGDLRLCVCRGFGCGCGWGRLGEHVGAHLFELELGGGNFLQSKQTMNLIFCILQ